MVLALTYGFTELGHYYIVTQCYYEHYDIHNTVSVLRI